MKGPPAQVFRGVYSNPKLTHTISSLLGCIVQLQVKNGEMFEGILKTFSQKVDFALELVHKVDFKKPDSPSSLLSEKINPDEVVEKMVFRIEDIVMVSAVDVDLDYVARDTFTDIGISKFNGQVTERILEPWEDAAVSNNDSLGELGNDEVSNGWDPNDMFKTNEQKYGVKSSFDSNMEDYTIKLKKQNTEEYKLQEAKASKIAQEIESSTHYKTRIALENGDEEERFSAVVRPEANASNNNSTNSGSLSSSSSTISNNSNTSSGSSNRFTTYRNRKQQGVLRPARSSPSPNAHVSNRIVNSHPLQHPPPQPYHKAITTSSQAISSQGKIVTLKSVPQSIPSAPRPLPQRQIFMSNSQGNSSQQSSSGQLPPMASRTFTPSSSSAAARNSPTSSQPAEEVKINGDAASALTISQAPAAVVPTGPPPGALNLPVKEQPPSETQSNNELPQNQKEVPEKKIMKKAHDEKTDELRRFHEKFKLPDMKESKKETTASVPSVPEVPDSVVNRDPSPKPVNEIKSKSGKVLDQTDEESISEAMKNSNLNPNAKEFSLNPNAKTFTPRGLSVPTNMLPPAPPPPQQPPPVQPPPRMHAQSPVIAVPQPHLVPSIPHPVFNVTPHYVVPTPVTMPVAPPYTPQSSVAQQAPRYRKDQGYGLAMEVNECEDVIFSAMPMTFPRTDSSQSIHVQAATGQPILAPHALSTPQFTIQYASPGILHPPPGPPQHQLTYTQMYSVGHRVIAPQALGMVSTAGSYGENHHVPTQIYMNPQAMAAHQGPPGSSGQHSTPSTPQSQTPNLHPAPSPVHQPPPPSGGPHGQAQTPTGHPSNPPTPHLVYHGQLTAAQHLSAAANHGHPYSAAAAMYGAGPQPIMLLPQQAVTGPHPHHHHPAQFSAAMQNHFHAQAAGAHGGGGGGPTQIIPHPPMALMPTSTAMAHAQVSLTNSHFAHHSQV